jgi:Protein-L-isoaspartate(D-aspartate) O-methyltransferase (PCMT)
LSFIEKYWSLRRKLLKTFVPEFIWPKESVIDGVGFKIRNTPYSYGTKQALKTGNYEVSERHLLRNQVKPGDVIIEMGGSIGILTAILAKQTGDNGLIISVEASESIAAYSKTWLEKKGNIKVLTGFAFPVFSLTKKVTINSFDEQGGSLGGKLLFDIDETGGIANKEEDIFDIEKIMQRFNISPTVLVVDVEGSEKIITAVKPVYPVSVRLILMEMHTHMYGADTRDQIINCIEGDGFSVVNEEHGVYLFERA